MTNLAATFLRGILFALAIGVAYPVIAAPPTKGHEQAAEAIAAPAARAESIVQGVGSCAAANCHGSSIGGASPRWASSYTTWASEDPHARAYQVLLGERSQQMARLLGKERMQGKPPEQAELCLNCHSLQSAVIGPQLPHALLVDGVGCESCHGASSEWRTQHYLDTWKSLTPADKLARGYIELKTPKARADACAGCHIGSPRQEVNHDLIAAGHPRLAFEFSAFQQKLPKHWDTKAERAQAGFEAQSWAVGQAVSLSAAARLLAARASQAADRKSTWPEFAEFDCFACHHDLQNKSWRRTAARGGALGLPGWGTWYLPMAGSLAAAPPTLLQVPTSDLQKSLDQLTTSAQQSWRAPNTKALSATASDVARFAEAWASALDDPKKYDAQVVNKLLQWATGDGQQLAQDWDGAAQLYLGIVALDDSARRYQGKQPKADTEQRNKAFAAALKKLEFPSNFDSPRDFTPQDFQTELRVMHRLLGSGQ